MRRIGLIPVAAKPYHAGHHALVTMAAAENDEVWLFVSTSDRARKGEMPLLGADMLKVWQEHLEPIMPSNVNVEYGGSPVQKVYVTLGDAEGLVSGDVWTVYSDPEDTALNYPEKNRVKYFPHLYEAGQVVFAAEEDPGRFTRGEGTPDVSGTKMRAALASGDVEAFRRGMPAGVDADAVFDILSPKAMGEALLRAYVRSLL
jgi:hypothetical protein